MKKPLKKYLVTVGYPSEIESARTVRFIEVEASSPVLAQQKARKIASEWIGVRDYKEIP